MGCERGICLGTSSYLAVQNGEESAGVGCVCVPLCQCLPVKEATGMKQGWQHKQLLPAEFASLKHHYTLHRMLGYQDYTKDGFS